MGCLSHCRFSNWNDHGDYNTGRPADPRSFCIQKTLQDVPMARRAARRPAHVRGHNVYQFRQDPFYANGFVPTVTELVRRILTGY